MRHKQVVISTSMVLMLCHTATSAPDQKSGLGPNGLGQGQTQQVLEWMKLRNQQPFLQEGGKGPEGTYFHVRYKNASSKPLYAGPLLEQSTILLDGIQYQYHGPEPTYFHIQAGEDSFFLMSPDDFVPKIKRSILADTLHRWRWVSGIPQGEHTLSFQFGGRQYGPVLYYWSGAGSWSVPHG